jgi:hypothetical protein
MIRWFVKVVREMLHVLFGLARIPCRQMRLKPGVAAMMPAVVREPLEHVHCERWKFHGDRHEAKVPDGVERW